MRTKELALRVQILRVSKSSLELFKTNALYCNILKIYIPWHGRQITARLWVSIGFRVRPTTGFTQSNKRCRYSSVYIFIVFCRRLTHVYMHKKMCTVGNVVHKQINKYFQAKQNNSVESLQCANIVGSCNALLSYVQARGW